MVTLGNDQPAAELTPKRRGRPPTPVEFRKRPICISVPPAQLRFLREQASKRNISISKIIHDLVFRHIAEVRKRDGVTSKLFPPTASLPELGAAGADDAQ